MNLLNAAMTVLLSVFFGSFTALSGNGGDILSALKIMGLGMVGIFIVTVVIIALVTVLNKVTSGIKKDKKEDK